MIEYAFKQLLVIHEGNLRTDVKLPVPNLHNKSHTFQQPFTSAKMLINRSVASIELYCYLSPAAWQSPEHRYAWIVCGDNEGNVAAAQHNVSPCQGWPARTTIPASAVILTGPRTEAANENISYRRLKIRRLIDSNSGFQKKIVV